MAGTTYLIVAPGGSGHTVAQADEHRPAGIASIPLAATRYGVPMTLWAFESRRPMEDFHAAMNARAVLILQGIFATPASQWSTAQGIVQDLAD